MVIGRIGFRQCSLFPIKWSWLCRKGVSFPPWGAFKELLAREARRGAFPLGDWPAGISCVLLSSFQELVEFYQQNSLKDCFKSLDTILQFPFKEPERRAISKPAGRRPDAGGLYPYLLPIVEENLGIPWTFLPVNMQRSYL